MSNLVDYLKGKSFAKQSKESIGKHSLFKSIAFSVLSSMHFRRKDEKQVFIHSSFRSGSTWLAEMLSSLDKARLINEPLSPYKYKLANLISPIPPSQIYFKDSSEAVLKYISLLVQGKTHISNRYDVLSKHHSFVSSLAVFKFLRVTPLAGTLAERFDGAHVVLIRHPISTAWSKVKSGIRVEGRVEQFLQNEAFVAEYLTRKEVDLAKAILKKADELEISILEWCLDNKPLVSLRTSNNSNLVFVSYEQLVESPVEVVSSILNKVGKLDSKSRIYNNTTKISAAAGSYSSEEVKLKLAAGRAKDLLYKFSTSLKADNIKAYHSIISDFNMDIYSDVDYKPTNFFDNFK